jgi:hypothetical protein
MAKKAENSKPPEIVVSPAFPHTGPQLCQKLRAALGKEFGKEPTLDRLAEILGPSTSKIHYWFKVYRNPHVIAFLSLVERLPERKRIELINECCRELPSMDSPRLAHDPAAIGRLENLLRLTNSITLVRGGTEFQRTFLISALANRLPRIAGPRCTVDGIDVHSPSKWVPVVGVVYLRDPLPIARVQELAIRTWPQIRSSNSRLVLFNSIWSTGPSLQDEILKLAKGRHVILADAKCPEARELAERYGVPVHVVTVSTSGEDKNWIRVGVEAF